MLKLATDKIHLEYQEAVDVNSGRLQIHLTGRNGTEWQRILSNPAAAAATPEPEPVHRKEGKGGAYRQTAQTAAAAFQPILF